jgi:hypothetical protein
LPEEGLRTHAAAGEVVVPTSPNLALIPIVRFHGVCTLTSDAEALDLFLYVIAYLTSDEYMSLYRTQEPSILGTVYPRDGVQI